MTTEVDRTLSLSPPTDRLLPLERAGLALVGVGALLFLVAAAGAGYVAPLPILVGGIAALAVGGGLYFRKYLRRPSGVHPDGVWHRSSTARGAVAWVFGVVLTGFYVLVYWFPWALAGLTAAFDPLSQAIRGRAADQWFMYGTFYTLAVLVMGARSLVKFRSSRYHLLRTVSVMFFQLGFAFLIPYVLVFLQRPELYFHYFWPLDYDLLFPSRVSELTASPGRIGFFMVVWGTILTFIATPVLSYFYGKRWYCSWVCGCGGLAETAGDPYRHLSDNSLRAWRIERWMIHGVLAAIVLVTALLWIDGATGLLGGWSGTLASWYGFYIGAVFSGVIGVGFYPLMGARVWCRFGCPLAAIIGLFQRFFSRFRITTNGGQCISCGNCSTYCEMGIDVRWYAQRGQNVIRASCVGCGICATVCPRGVLKLENGPREGRFNGPQLYQLDLLGDDDVLPSSSSDGRASRG